MSQLLSFPPPAPDEAPALGRIRLLSRPLAWLFTALLALGSGVLAVAVVAVLTYTGTRLQVWPGGMQIYVEATVPPVPPTWTTVGQLPLIQKLALAVSATVMMGPALAILWELRRLFGLYVSGVVLAVENARRIGRIAAWLIAYAVAPTIGHFIVDLSGFDDRGWLRFDSLQALLLGLVLFVIARGMLWGAAVQDDASRFV